VCRHGPYEIAGCAHTLALHTAPWTTQIAIAPFKR
jgi:hypothetical protein